MAISIWYISKYMATPGADATSGRGYQLMKELVKMGHQVAIITSNSNIVSRQLNFKNNYAFESIGGVNFCFLKIIKYSTSKSIRRVISWLHFEWVLLRVKQQKLLIPDVIIVSSLSLLTILNGILLRRKYSCKLIFEVRDIWPLTITAEGGISKYNPFVIFLAFLERLAYKYSDVIVGTMPNLGEHVSEVLGYSKTTYCVPMGVEESKITDQKKQQKNPYQDYFQKNKFIIAYAGTLGISNAMETFFECALLMKNNSKIEFFVVGDGDLSRYYQEKYGHLTNLVFKPRVPKSGVQDILSCCDLLYFATFNSEVWRFGQSLNKVIDYMLAGKPIIASYSGYQSMINEAQSGTFVPAQNVFKLKAEIERYLGMSIAERKQIGMRGREWIISNRRYSKLAKSYLQILTNSNNKIF